MKPKQRTGLKSVRARAVLLTPLVTPWVTACVVLPCLAAPSARAQEKTAGTDTAPAPANPAPPATTAPTPTAPTPTAPAAPPVTPPAVPGNPADTPVPAGAQHDPLRSEPDLARPVAPAIVNPNTVLPAAPLSQGDTPPVQRSTTQTAAGGTDVPDTAAGATPPGATPPDTGTAPGPPELPGGPEDQAGTEQPGGNFSLESPDGVIYDMERGLALARSKVKFRYREFVVDADRGIIDYNTNRATMAGNLTVTVRGRVFTGKTLVFNLDTGQWTLSSVATEFGPEFFPPGTVLSPIYVRDGSVVGEDDRVRGENFKFSSCDRDHYYLLSKRLEFYRTPGGEPERIVLRKNSLYVLGRRIAPLPVYAISLLGATARRQPLQTTFGQNDIDGYFAKSLYNLHATSKLTDSLLVDAFQKRGLGLGFQREYAAGAGLLYLYAISSQQNGRQIDSRVDRTLRLSRLFRTNFKFNSTQNSSLTGPGVSSRSGQFTLFREGERAQSTAIANFSDSNFGLGTSKSGSLQFEHHQDFGSGFKLETSSLLNQSQSSFGTEAATSDQSAILSRTSKLFDTFLRTELHDDLTNHKSYQLERLPELTLQSTTDRLPLPGLKDYLPGDFTFGMGRFNEPSSGKKLDRADFFYTARNKNYRLMGNGGSKSLLRGGGTFEQAFYSDSTARYNYAYNLGMDNTLGALTAQVNYSKQKTFGFTPFQFDFSTPGEYVDANLSYQPSDKFRLNLSAGRDIQNKFSRDVIARVQWSPSLNFYSSVGTSFAPETHKLGDVYGNFRIATSRQRFGGGQFAFGVRYSPQGQGLTRANASVDIQLGAKTRLQGFAGYDGFSKTFDFTQFRITRDLHCFNLYATYDGQRKELRFDLAIKAFPFADSRFGRNQFSEGFDPSVGDIQ